MSDFANALISKKPKAELQDKLNLFGQFIGNWEFEGVFEKGTADEWRVPGEWLFSWILGGSAIQDVFICPSRKEQEKNPHPNAEYGTTVRFYNPKTDTWNMCYGLFGEMHLLEAMQIGEQIIVKNKTETEGLAEWVFSDITPNSFHWQNRTSNDDGVTWQVVFELFAKRK
ncbi:MAG: hypothetical protein LBG64_00185 [Pseudomonadales bacterium]|jgi:hypothetical protein|nr:hypothetical protein [Pseudomonadales bacterium]